MSSATVTSKGQITIPKAVRTALSLRAGDTVDFVESERGVLLIPINRDLKALRGILKGRRKKPATIEDMNRAIAEMGSGR
jgi:AbrB family looped-hinge helix DNA binding protein